MRNLPLLRSVRRWGWRLANPAKPLPRLFAQSPDAKGSFARAEASPRKTFDRVWIHVGLGPQGRWLGLISPAHLQAFGIEPELCDPLYEVWLQLLNVSEEAGLPNSLEAQAVVMQAALQVSQSPVGYHDCYRWVLLMNTAFLLSLVPLKGEQR